MDRNLEAGDAAGRESPWPLQPSEFPRPPQHESLRPLRTDLPRPILKNENVSRKKSQPGVIWDDERSIATHATIPGQTFYDDSTPPSSPIEQVTTTEPSDGGYHSRPTMRLDSYDYKYDHVAAPAPLPERRTRFGLSRRAFWMVIAIAGLIVLIAVAVGVGVGVGVNSNKSASSGQPEDAHSQTTPPTSTTLISSAPEPTMPPTPGVCPTANNTLFQPPGSNKTFLRLCGIDYTGLEGGEDLATVWTASMPDCITSCAGFPTCEACSWGVLEGDVGDNHRCFLKRRLKQSSEARPGWDFAVLQ